MNFLVLYQGVFKFEDYAVRTVYPIHKGGMMLNRFPAGRNVYAIGFLIRHI